MAAASQKVWTVTCPAAWLENSSRHSARLRLVRGVSWTVLGNAVSQGSSFLSAIFLARLLGKLEYGQFAVIQSTVLALSSLAGMGLGITATKYVSQYRSNDPRRVGQVLGLSSSTAILASLLCAAGLFAYGPQLLSAPAQTAFTRANLWLAAVAMFFTTINGYQMGAMAGFEAFRAIARINIIWGLINFAAVCAFGFYFGLTGAVLAQAAAAIALWALYQSAVGAECRKTGIRVSYRGAWSQRAVLTGFSIPAAASGVIMAIAIWWCNLLLVRQRGYGELAVFNAVNSMRAVMIFLPGLIIRVAAPLLNSMRVTGDLAAYGRTLRHTIALNIGLALFLAIGLSLVGSRLLTLFGKGFVSSPMLIPMLLGSVVLEIAANTLFQALFASGELWRSLAIGGVWATTLLSCAVLATSRLGATGLAVSYFAAWAVSAGMFAVATRSHFQKAVCR